MTAASALSAAGRYSFIWMVSAGLGLIFSDDRSGFIMFGIVITAEWIFTNGPFKLLFRRERPDNSDVVDMLPAWLHPPRSSSFPSGHSSASSFATVIWWSFSPITGVLCGAVALAMGLSRVLIRAHHKTDVLAGWIWGAVLGGTAVAVLGERLFG